MGKRRRPNTSLMLDPLKIAYSQDSISFKFVNGTLLSTAIAKLVRGTLKLSQFPPIRVFHLRNTWFSLDNRRLYVFKEAAKKGIFTQIPVLDTPSTEFRRYQIDAKLTTMNAGRQVTVRGAAARTVAITKCHYCLKECKTAGYLSLHCQEDHMEEYLEETRATFQTIDQFLMSKDFAIRDDLLVSLEHLQVETDNSTHRPTKANNLAEEFRVLSRIKVRVTDVTHSKLRKTICGTDQTANKENMPSNRTQVIYQKKPDQLYWQSEEMTARNDIYATNLFNKILHFKDLKYPLS
ncbi:uncharacterized protein LOC134819554 [Bolinopsis microptera]|uniref:uncharacterized protein LOC134819554 n=1 Tax=Bolinopsis microptera TaxID=2820187 RepID=UPI003079E1B9